MPAFPYCIFASWWTGCKQPIRREAKCIMNRQRSDTGLSPLVTVGLQGCAIHGQSNDTGLSALVAVDCRKVPAGVRILWHTGWGHQCSCNHCSSQAAASSQLHACPCPCLCPSFEPCRLLESILILCRSLCSASGWPGMTAPPPPPPPHTIPAALGLAMPSSVTSWPPQRIRSTE